MILIILLFGSCWLAVSAVVIIRMHVLIRWWLTYLT